MEQDLREQDQGLAGVWGTALQHIMSKLPESHRHRRTQLQDRYRYRALRSVSAEVWEEVSDEVLHEGSAEAVDEAWAGVAGSGSSLTRTRRQGSGFDPGPPFRQSPGIHHL
jgi:hypothetical protein